MIENYDQFVSTARLSNPSLFVCLSLLLTLMPYPPLSQNQLMYSNRTVNTSTKMSCRLNIELVECEHTCTLGECDNVKTTTKNVKHSGCLSVNVVPSFFGLERIALAALAKLLNTPPTTAVRPID